MSDKQRFVANMVRLEQQAHRKSFEDWYSAMSYKIFLLEIELGYEITEDSNGLRLMERLNMFDRYCIDKKAEQDKIKEGNDGSSNKNKGLMK